jgi:sialic acid synthase SpsE
MVKEVRRTELALGRINYNISYSSRKNMNSRRSIYISNKINKGEIVITHNTPIANIKSLVANELYSYLKDTCDKDWGFRELIEQNTDKSNKNGIIIRVYMK